MKVTLPIQHDTWMLNGTETLYRLLTDIEGCQAVIHDDMVEIDIHDKEVFLRNLAHRIESKRDLVIFCKKFDEKGQERYVRKDFVLIQYGKAGDRNVLREKIYLETSQRLGQIFSDLEPGKRTCVLCGRTYKKKVDNLKQAVHPFATKIRSLSGVRTMKENFDNICPLCYLVGTVQWLDEGMVYRCFVGPRKRTHSVILLPFEMDLKKTNEAKRRYLQVLNGQNQQVSNIMRIGKDEKLMPTEGENTTFLKFFEEFIDRIMEDFKEEELEFDVFFETVERTFCKQWSMLVIPSGTVKNVKYRPLVLEDETVTLLAELGREGTKMYDHILERISVMRKEKVTAFDETNALREDAAKFAIENNFRRFSRIFLPKKNKVVFFGNIRHLDRLICLWRLRKMGLEQELEALKGAGESLAKLVGDHLSILYSMDKAKTRADFLRAFEQASKRVIGPDAREKRVYPIPLEKVADLIIESDENQWKEIRDALIIYTSISLSKLRYFEEKEKKKGDAK
ncbi:MAG: hypothetical protein HXS52_14195 [Theionarchaea archaeon]|nr:hypothetical protein [Theionarchaea archaeon]